jgi:hypothetical protein
LAISNEPDALLHKGADGKVVSVPGVDTDEPDPAHLTGEEDHLVGRLGNVGLEHERFLDLVEDGLGLVEGGAVNAD